MCDEKRLSSKLVLELIKNIGRILLHLLCLHDTLSSIQPEADCKGLESIQVATNLVSVSIDVDSVPGPSLQP